MSDTEPLHKSKGEPVGRLEIVTGSGRRRLEEGAFRWPPISDGVMRLSASQLAALVDGLDWSRLQARDIAAPESAS